MKWIYILIVLVIAVSALGCVDKNQTETKTQTSVQQGETGATPEEVATSPEVSSTANGDDLFGTESDLSALNMTFGDMNMEISLLDSI
jgi:hypothetical protein